MAVCLFGDMVLIGRNQHRRRKEKEEEDNKCEDSLNPVPMLGIARPRT